jgi:hypothetical protein
LLPDKKEGGTGKSMQRDGFRSVKVRDKVKTASAFVKTMTMFDKTKAMLSILLTNATLYLNIFLPFICE